MNVATLCPDDLVIQARTGALGPKDEARLAFHLERCPRCRTALEVGRDFDAVLGARAGDDAIANRIAGVTTGRPTRRWIPYAAGVGLLLSGSLAVASAGTPVLRLLGVSAHLEEKTPSPRTPTPKALGPEKTPEAKPSPPSPDAATESAAAPSESETPRQTVQAPFAPPRSRPSALELFAEANQLRSQGKGGEARRRYAELRSLYPSSSEAKVSLVSLGRLELASKPGEALRHFNAYLAQRTHTTLTEEALFGRAKALGLLGRGADERAAWQDLLRRFPSSVYSERAKARLAATP